MVAPSRLPSGLARTLAGLLALLAALACRPPVGPARPNALLITVDTLRADRLGCYGYERDTSPNLDAFAREGVLFERAYSHAPFTAPSHASLFTALHTQSHGVRYWGQPLDPSARTLAERFGDAGYATAAFYNHPGLESTDVTRGFEHVELYAYEPGEDSVEALFAWLEEERPDPFCVWLHLWDVHRPYGWRDWSPEWLRERVDREKLTYAFGLGRFGEAGDPVVGRNEAFYNLNAADRAAPKDTGTGRRLLEPRDYRWIEDRYDGGVWEADRALGLLFEGLRERGLYEETAIVVTADHGETLTERESCYFTHDPHLYEQTLRVPLIVRLPQGRHAGERPALLARGVDVLPTLLEVCDLPLGRRVQGRSLLPALRGESLPAALLFAETQSLNAKERDQRVAIEAGQVPRWLEHRQAVSDGRFKLMVDLESGARRLFDLQTDPEERVDRFADPELAVERARLLASLESFRQLPVSGEEIEWTEELEAELQKTGYLGEE